jgi:hypothetical protein
MGPDPRSELIDRMRRFAEPAEVAGLTVRLERVPGDLAAHDDQVGSHAERVLRTTPCPVLLVGASTATAEAPPRIREILCAASGSEHSPRTLDYARSSSGSTTGDRVS